MDNRLPILVGLLGLWLGAGDAQADDTRFGPADPVAKDPAQFDPRRPVARELDMEVPDGFAVSAAGDLIISRPLSQYAKRLEAFGSLVGILQRSDVAYGNLETTIFDPRSFKGSPYSWDGDWTVSALPAVAGDLRQMGFGMVSRANNHALDWGIEGMQETGRWLDQAGIVHAGAGDTHGAARAPQYLEAPRARVALVSLASTFRPTSESLPASGLAPGRPGVSGLRLAEVLQVPPAALRALQAAR
jgi:poly-gamma-glutamate synthesis protein (capsule biosynthesis protein)